MEGRKGAFRVILRVLTPPQLSPHTGKIEPPRTFIFDSADRQGHGRDIQSITTSKSLGDPCGSVTVSVVPRRVAGNRTWADLIPAYSLVRVEMQRWPNNREPELVMLCLTGPSTLSESYEGAEPHRSITLTMREVSCVLVDHRTFYLSVPPESVQHEETPALGGVDGQIDVPKLYGQRAAIFGMVAIDPVLALVGDSPVDAIGRFVRMLTVGEKTENNQRGEPLLNLQYPGDLQLRDILHFDEKKARELLFDQNAELPASNQTPSSGESLWSIMQGWSDPSYQELFSETRSRTGEESARFGGSVAIIFRRKPFAGRLDESGQLRDVAAVRGSQFDPVFAEENTVEATPHDLMQATLTGNNVDQISNLYYVYPVIPSVDATSAWRNLHGPLIDNTPESPSYWRRFGLRLRQVADLYLSPDSPNRQLATPASGQTPAEDNLLQRFGGNPGDVGSLEQIARNRERLLWAWHRFEPLFQRGSMTFVGRPDYRVGKRLVVKSATKTEFYIESVTHSMTFNQSPRWRTTVQVGRGWPI